MFSGHVQIVRGNILIVRIRKNEMLEKMLLKGKRMSCVYTLIKHLRIHGKVLREKN